ncbi:MAG: hypothetical protein V1734_06765 [Nanoarchaeota archaeon]
MKTYKGMPWDEFIGFIGETAKQELRKEAPIIDLYGVTSTRWSYGKFGSLESNYTLREGRGLIGKLLGAKIFTIHDNSAKGILPRVIIHDTNYFGQKVYEIFKTIGGNLHIDFSVEYA